MVRDLILTPISHSSPIYPLRPGLDQPCHRIDKLTVREHRNVLGRMFRNKIQERLSSGYEVQKRFCTRPIPECRIGSRPVRVYPLTSLGDSRVRPPTWLEIPELLSWPSLKRDGQERATVAIAVYAAREQGEATIRSGALRKEQATKYACSTRLGVGGIVA